MDSPVTESNQTCNTNSWTVPYFDNNINFATLGLLGGSGIRANHGYQFNHDAAETWDFYELLKTEMGFGASHGSGAIAINKRPALLSKKPVLPSAFIDGDLAESNSVIQPRWSSLSGKVEVVSKSVGSSTRVDTPTVYEYVDFALHDWLSQRLPEGRTLSDGVLPCHNDLESDEYVVLDAFFGTLGGSLDSVLS